MSADRPYLQILVKDDLSRFFYQDSSLPTKACEARKNGSLGAGRAESLVERGFESNGLFQRYPNILETSGEAYQQLNKNIKFKISGINLKLIKISQYFLPKTISATDCGQFCLKQNAKFFLHFPYTILTHPNQ